jgi:hypothetical protein
MARAGFLSLLGLVSAFGPLRAQGVTGALEARVIAAQGEAIEGVQITVHGPSLQGARSAVTDARGRFVLSVLPAGPYTVAIRRIGYGPVRFENVPVRLGSTTSLGDIRLTAQAVEVAEIVVSGARPILDPVSAATGATLDSSRFLSLPAERGFRDLMKFAPQANASPLGDGVNVGGSTGLENAFYVDGMNATVGAGSSVELPFNFVREIQVTTGGYEAEFGRALSGVINVVTPSGGNAFHGQVLGFFTSDGLQATPRAGLGQPTVGSFSRYDVGVSLSGPIVHDRLWYSAAYNPTFGRQEYTVAALPKQEDSQVRHLVAGKLTWRAGARTDVSMTLLSDPSSHDTTDDSALPATTDPNVALARLEGGGTTVAAQLRHDFDPRAQFSLGISRLDRSDNYLPRSGGTDLGSLTRIDETATNASTGGLGFYQKASESRTAVRAALTLFRGRHTAKVGAEYEVNTFHTEVVYSLLTHQPTGEYDWSLYQLTAKVQNLVPTVYVQDAWELSPRLRVSAGVRWEAQHLSGETGEPHPINSEIAPRLGVVYQLGEPGTQRLFASAGRFFEQIPGLSQVFWNGVGAQLAMTFPQNPLVDSSNGVVLGKFDYTGVPQVDGLVGQYYDQVGAGYERRLGTSYRVGVRGTYRALRWVVEDGVAPGDSVYRMGNPGRGPLATMPRAEQHYAALELSIERSTSGPVYLLASYVLSRNAGNFTGMFENDLLMPLPNSGPQYDFPDLMAGPSYGLLANDRTHYFKGAASYRFGMGATVGGFLTVASGTPKSEWGTSAYGAPYHTFVSQRGAVGRTPMVWSLDLHSSYDLPVGHGRVRPHLLLDVFNIGSPRSAVLYEYRHYLDDQQSQVNPNYGLVTRYQPPMSARAGMVVDF